MSDKHTLTLGHQVKQSRRVKRLEAENRQLRAALLILIDEYYKDGKPAGYNQSPWTVAKEKWEKARALALGTTP